MVLDLVLKGGRVVTPDGVVRCDVGVADGTIAALDEGLAGAREIDAGGLLVLPGGIDSHCHMEQESSFGGLMTADDFTSGTRAAAFGGTTTVIPFACQRRGASLARAVDDYAERAARGAHVDYAFHLMVTDPTPQVLGAELPALLAAGHRSIKLFMAYERLRVGDRQMLDVMDVARAADALVIVHAENGDVIDWSTAALVADGRTEPRHHPLSHPAVAEVEAVHRLARLAGQAGVPVVVLHVSAADTLDEIRAARARGTALHAETCPHYLCFTAADMDLPGPEAAKWCCSPPLRDDRSRDALWAALAEGLFDVVSSDHAPYRFDATGKLVRGPEPTFAEVPNGLPGIELRLPVLFSEGVVTGRLSLEQFARLAATRAAELYGLAGRKGSIAVGADADLAIWDPQLTRRVRAEQLHDACGYTPYEGREVTGWPTTVIRRGEVVVQDGALRSRPGSGRLLRSHDPPWDR